MALHWRSGLRNAEFREARAARTRGTGSASNPVSCGGESDELN